MEIVLTQNETLVIDGDQRELRLLCGSGQLWITRTGDTRDYLLTSGQALTLSGRGRIVIWALKASTLQSITATLVAPAHGGMRLLMGAAAGR